MSLLHLVTIVVDDYDPAIRFFVDVLDIAGNRWNLPIGCRPHRDAARARASDFEPGLMATTLARTVTPVWKVAATRAHA